MRGLIILAVVALLAVPGLAQVPEWAAAMQAVHATFDGTPGTIGHFGDSITDTGAYWGWLSWATISNVSGQDQPAVSWIKNQAGNTYVNPLTWSWHSNPQAHLALGGTKSDWPLQIVSGTTRRIDQVLAADNPEMVVIMWGSNDAANNDSNAMPVATYKANMRAVAQACIGNGTIPILMTPPPRHLRFAKTQEYATAIRELGAELHVPVADFMQEILTRNPDPSWDGADPMWAGYSGYEVPTSISGDGVHPSNPSAWQTNFSAAGLQKNGFALRTHLAMKSTYEVYQYVIAPEPASMLLLVVGGALLSARRRNRR